jgi:cell division GTPase FtsZ
MASTTSTSFAKIRKNKIHVTNKGEIMSGQENQEQPQSAPIVQTDDFMDLGDLDFVDHYGEDKVDDKAELLPENTAQTAISCAFVGIGGGGGKLAKAFLDLGYNRTVLINTTHKDQPAGTSPQHFLLLDGADGVGKDIKAGQQVLSDNATFVEDTLRARLGKVDWLFVCASGGGGTGSSAATLNDSFQRYLDSVQAQGNVVYIVSEPTSQEKLNPTIKTNYTHLLNNVKQHSHIVIDNERQLELLRGKVGMLGMYPSANTNFAKMISQVFKLASESSPIQSFDTQDLEKCLKAKGRLFLGTCAIRDFRDGKLGLKIFKGCSERSPCPVPNTRPSVGCLLLIVSTATASDPIASNQIESAISYVGGRSDTLFSGVYVRENIPGVVAICALGGM